MKKLLTYLIILFVAGGCGEEKSHPDDNYFINESYLTKSDDCSIYQMIFDDGDYMFRYALSGKCDLLTTRDYITEYERFLQMYNKPFPVNEGLIIFEHYYLDKLNNEMIKEINMITENEFEATVTIKEINDNSFVLKLEKKLNTKRTESNILLDTLILNKNMNGELLIEKYIFGLTELKFYQKFVSKNKINEKQILTEEHSKTEITYLGKLMDLDKQNS